MNSYKMDIFLLVLRGILLLAVIGAIIDMIRKKDYDYVVLIVLWVLVLYFFIDIYVNATQLAIYNGSWFRCNR